ncbi:nickel-binding protein [Cyclobacterium plantarum]|uniref:DUF4242 domain-containing protein n=1 Tax=Cyclobacterium plantarum TaxID=2716263 RepID=A0ABX0HA92_9BACT|nr:nickel-binding protein [Cyclobacterium plantarum]NHE58557.1 DUF4242 domain-containing protein [Cyclobacterium plantarum]
MMPIYMDRHDLSAGVTAENVARLHQEDLKIQEEFNCRGLTYWFDAERKTAFCLVEAPDAASVHRMHDYAHGQVPHAVIEVDAGLVESFLGRMEDPKANSGVALNPISDPAYRFLLSAQIGFRRLETLQLKGLPSTIRSYKSRIVESIHALCGTVVRQEGRHILASFKTAGLSVECGWAAANTLALQYPDLTLNLGLDGGIPVTESKSIFEDTVRSSKRLCESRQGFSISSVVLELYEDYSSKSSHTRMGIVEVSASELVFLHRLLDYLDLNFSCTELSIDNLAYGLGLSRSQLFRKTRGLMNCAPSILINSVRLEKSLEIFSRRASVSETAYLCGFNSSSYFSKCFHKKYGVSPKDYILAMHE